MTQTVDQERPESGAATSSQGCIENMLIDPCFDVLPFLRRQLGLGLIEKGRIPTILQ
jgi:hypothetical protein